MAENKLRLAIVTTLDNAGIKATKKEIQDLENAITKANRSGGGGGGKGGGLFGDVDNQVAGLAKKGLGVVAILRSVGSLANEVISKATVDGKSWGEAFTSGAKSFLEKTSFSAFKFVGLDFDNMLQQATAEMQKRINDLNASLTKHYAKWQQDENELLQSKLKTHQQTLKAIDDETSRYQKQLKVVNQIRGNTDTAE